MKKISKLLFYGGLDKEIYDNVRLRVSEENRRSVSIFTLISAGSFVITAVASLLSNPGVPLSSYVIGAGIFILMHILNKVGVKKYPAISNVFAIVFSLVLLVFGILIAYNQINDRTTMLLPMFTLVSLVFCYRPVYLVSILIVLETIYLLLMKKFQLPELFYINAVNTCIFCVIGIIGGFYTMSFKYKRYKAEYENHILLERDSLTGVFNRYSCSKELEKIGNENRPVTICSFDVNGLKTANDTLGHLAGDELIIGAAECISDVFGEFGNVYRMGGDEFCVLAYNEFDEKLIREKFNARLKTWKGKINESISIAFGTARLDHNFKTGIDEIFRKADEQMYASKREYYITHDRRKS